MVAVLNGPGIDVDILRLLPAEFFDALIDVFLGDCRLGIGDFDAAELTELDYGDDFEFGLESEGLAVVEMDILYIGLADHVEVFGFELLLQELGDEIFQHLLPDIAGELLTDDAGRGFARPESGEFGALLDIGRDASQLAFHIEDRDGNFERVLATFN
jgi:hypothetical protein